MSLISLFWEIKFNLEYQTKTRRKKSLHIKIKWLIAVEASCVVKKTFIHALPGDKAVGSDCFKILMFQDLCKYGSKFSKYTDVINDSDKAFL